jgi:hypothetical protein
MVADAVICGTWMDRFLDPMAVEDPAAGASSFFLNKRLRMSQWKSTLGFE